MTEDARAAITGADVVVTATSVSVKSVLYGVDVPLTEVTAVSLEPTLPRILRRTNGYGGKTALRGHFLLAGLGEGQLFVELDHPPFVLVRTTGGFFYVSFEDPARTQGLYRELLDAWQRVRPERAPG